MAARLRAGLPLLVWYWLQLPVVKPRLSDGPAGRMIKEQFWFREQGRLRYRRAQGALFLPATFSHYQRGRHRQAVRTNVAHARNSGMTVECVSIPVWAPGPDDCRAGLLQGMVSTVSYARWLLHTAIVERLCGECTLLLTNSDDVPLLSSGNQHFQRLLGYSIVRIRARRSWSELVSDVYVRTVAMCLTVAALIVAVELGT